MSTELPCSAGSFTGAMVLIIPAIDLSGGCCVRRTGNKFSPERVYFDDPVKMARLWRVQNARVLHLSSHDPDDRVDRKILKSICDAVDIPIQFHGRFSEKDDVATALDAGIYRVVVEISSVESIESYAQIRKNYGSSKVIAGIHACQGVIKPSIGEEELLAVDIARQLEHAGCRRIVYTDLSPDADVLDDRCLRAFQDLGRSLKRARVTAAGGITGYSDLLRLIELSDSRIDSVVIGRALYENRFPCQRFWCWNDKDSVDLTCFSTARLTESGCR